MSSRHPKKPPHEAVSVDDAEIDFSAVVKAQAEAESTTQLAALLAAAAREEKQKQEAQHATEMRAQDPGLVAYLNRSAESHLRRRRKRLFGAGPAEEAAASRTDAEVLSGTHAGSYAVHSGSQTTATATANGMDASVVLQAASADAVAAFLSETTAEPHQGSLRERLTAYQSALHAFSTCEASAAALDYVPSKPGTSSSATATPAVPSESSSSATGPTGPAVPLGFPLCASQANSLIDAFLSDGVPDMEPWDQWAYTAPRYDAKAIAVHAHNPKSISDARMDIVPHPVLPASLYMTRHAQAAKAPVPLKVMKTKDELRAERKERLRQKQAKLREEREKKKKASVMDSGAGASSAASAAQSHDRLSFKHLAHNLFDASVLDPLGVDTKVLAGYQERFLEHQRQNHARHVEALPNQIAKRERDARRHAEENPSLAAYRVYPIYSPQHLGMLRNFANDNRLRGFVLWVGQCDALLVLTGGRVAMRHLDRWILYKTDWESPETRATCLCRVPLPHWQTFSFHNERKHTQPPSQPNVPDLKKARAEDTESDPRKKADDDREHVFISHANTVEDGEHFLRTVVPAGGTPWADLCVLWRTAFLADGLAAMPTEEA